jgi:hypothetical protein
MLWSVDRLHLSAHGHRRVAAHALAALGVPPPEDWWRAPAAPAARSWPARRAADLRWAGEHLTPWVRRRLAGESSGDQREPKRPRLMPVRGDEPRVADASG